MTYSQFFSMTPANARKRLKADIHFNPLLADVGFASAGLFGEAEREIKTFWDEIVTDARYSRWKEEADDFKIKEQERIQAEKINNAQELEALLQKYPSIESKRKMKLYYWEQSALFVLAHTLKEAQGIVVRHHSDTWIIKKVLMESPQIYRLDKPRVLDIVIEDD